VCWCNCEGNFYYILYLFEILRRYCYIGCMFGFVITSLSTVSELCEREARVTNSLQYNIYRLREYIYVIFYTTTIIIQPPIFHPFCACPPINHNWVNIFLCFPSTPPPYHQLQISNSPTLPPRYNILSLGSRYLHTYIL
jgi:hypothetical protein